MPTIGHEAPPLPGFCGVRTRALGDELNSGTRTDLGEQGLDPAVCSVVGAANHHGTFRFAIPNTSMLVGMEFHQHALVPDAAAGVIGR